jgi:hypothetical protein
MAGPSSCPPFLWRKAVSQGASGVVLPQCVFCSIVGLYRLNCSGLTEATCCLR